MFTDWWQQLQSQPYYDHILCLLTVFFFLAFFISLKLNYNGTENIINTDYYNKCSTNVAVHGGNNRVLVKYYNILHLHII